MVKRHNIRALVLYCRSNFFYVNGLPQGIYYAALWASKQSINQKLQAGKQHVHVTFQRAAQQRPHLRNEDAGVVAGNRSITR
jgi:hypothetical protein